MKKVCKQCGRTMHEDNFRKYSRRGAGIRKERPIGRHTICIKCENLNAQVCRYYKVPKGERSEAQQILLDKAKEFYIEMHKRGNEPKGRFARDVLGLGEHNVTDRDVARGSLDFIDSLLTPETPETEATVELNKLLTIELVDNPDVYNAIYDNEILPSIQGANGKVRPEYKQLSDQVLDRLAEYEDGYDGQS